MADELRRVLSERDEDRVLAQVRKRVEEIQRLSAREHGPDPTARGNQ